MSSRILRAALVRPDPLVIDNSEELWMPEAAEADALPDLMAALQEEHPEAGQEVIEDALQEAIDQLLQDDGPAPEGPAFGGFEAAEPARDAEPSAYAAVQLESEPLITPPPAAEPNVDELLAQARQTADEMIERARNEAAEVLREADSRAAEIERAAYDKGHEEGLSAGRRLGDEQAARELGQVAAIVDQATELHDEMLHEAETEMVALSLEIARKIIQGEVRTNPEVVKRVLAAAVQRINGSPRVTIKVNPADVQRITEHWASAYGPNYRDKQWLIEGDESVAPGGCVLETRYGSLDAQIGSQFEEIQKTFALLLGTEA
ncbi:MAG: hypothetical protein KGJ86_06110 [Chloroflexota bacterium]|nr:hypothetical protein [Chloroflexota bacterium]